MRARDTHTHVYHMHTYGMHAVYCSLLSTVYVCIHYPINECLFVCDCMYFSTQDGSFVIPDLMRLSQSKILVTTLVTARLLFLMGLPRGHFTHIFVDEAAQVQLYVYSICL